MWLTSPKIRPYGISVQAATPLAVEQRIYLLNSSAWSRLMDFPSL